MSGRGYDRRAESPPKRPREDGGREDSSSRRVRRKHSPRSRSRSPDSRPRETVLDRRSDRRHQEHEQQHQSSRRRDDHDDSNNHEGSRQHSHHHRRRHHHRHHHHKPASSSTVVQPPPPRPVELPFGSRFLSYRTDEHAFRPLLARYLEVQKQRYLGDMDEREIRGRWKSFVSKWNAGELAEGWYDPEVYAGAAEEYKVEHENEVAMKQERGDQQQRHTQDSDDRRGGGRDYHSREKQRILPRAGSPLSSRGATPAGQQDTYNSDIDDNDDQDYGPALPGILHDQDHTPEPSGTPTAAARHGPGMPNLQDLALRRELDAEERAQNRVDGIAQIRIERKADRALQREHLDELVPRADPGSHERKLEKKRELNDKLRSFRDKSPGGGGGAEVNDGELMGGGDSLAEHKSARAAEQRRKSEREIRREEEARAREEERQEKIRRWQDKEDKTMTVLREIARQRFG